MNEVEMLVNSNSLEHSPLSTVKILWYMVWLGTVEQLLEFMSGLNSIHKDSVSTYDYSNDGVEF